MPFLSVRGRSGQTGRLGDFVTSIAPTLSPLADFRRPGTKRDTATLCSMKRRMLLDHLAHVERHIREGERHLLRQRKIVDELERHGHGRSQTAQLAKDILDTFEMAQ